MSTVDWMRFANREWADTAVRRAVEAQCGFAPLPPLESLDWEAQRVAGTVAAYHARFRDWARARFEASRADAA